MEQKIRKEVDYGENICKLIKEIYFSQVKWCDCSREVAAYFTRLKAIFRAFHCMTKDQNVELMEKIGSLTRQDILDAFEMEPDLIKVETKKQDKYGDSVVWFPVPIENVELQSKIRLMLAA